MPANENVAHTVNCEFSVTYSTNADIHITVFQNEKNTHCKRLVEIVKLVVALMVVIEM